MIPKIVHYCWYGGEKPDYANNCIETWRRLLPSWQIIEWNESNTDLQCCAYVKEAYEKGIFAFVADYVRVDALIRHGGIYLDTDMELLKPLDGLLDCELLLGYESEDYFSTGIIGALPGNGLLKSLRELFQNIPHFEYPLTTINTYLTELFFERYPLERRSSRQSYRGIEIYPKEVFGPAPATDSSIAIHHYIGSWHR